MSPNLPRISIGPFQFLAAFFFVSEAIPVYWMLIATNTDERYVAGSFSLAVLVAVVIVFCVMFCIQRRYDHLNYKINPTEKRKEN